MDKKLEEILSIRKEELESRMIEIYKKQKLSPKIKKISRILQILVTLIFTLVPPYNFYNLIFAVVTIFFIWQLLRPRDQDIIIIEELKLVAEGMDNFKKYKNKEIIMKLDNKEELEIEKGIKMLVPHLLKNSTAYKIVGMIPLLNITFEDTYVYTHSGGPLNHLIKGSLITKGLEKFFNKNLPKK